MAGVIGVMGGVIGDSLRRPKSEEKWPLYLCIE
jgi:hypothetical protein